MSLCRTYYDVMTKGIHIMMFLDFLCYLCLGRDHGPMDPRWVAQASRVMGTDELSRVLLQKCAPKRHRWRQPIKFSPVISLYECSISVDFVGYAAMRVRM